MLYRSDIKVGRHILFSWLVRHLELNPCSFNLWDFNTGPVCYRVLSLSTAPSCTPCSLHWTPQLLTLLWHWRHWWPSHPWSVGLLWTTAPPWGWRVPGRWSRHNSWVPSACAPPRSRRTQPSPSGTGSSRIPTSSSGCRDTNRKRSAGFQPGGDACFCFGGVTDFQPMKRNCSQNQARTSISTMVGKANTNHEAKLITSPFSGKSLQRTHTEISQSAAGMMGTPQCRHNCGARSLKRRCQDFHRNLLIQQVLFELISVTDWYLTSSYWCNWSIEQQHLSLC